MSNNNLAFERLKGRENFSEWKTGAKAYLTSKGHWSQMQTELASSPSADQKSKNEKALAELILLIDSSLYSYVEDITEAKTAWDSLQSVFEDKGAARKVTLLKQWISLKSSECNSMHEYVNKSVALRAKVKAAGFTIAEDIAGSILLCGLSDDYKSLIMSMEVKDSLTLDYVKNVLLQNIDFDNNSENAMSANNKNKKKFGRKKNPKCYDCGGPHFRNKCTKNKNYAEKGDLVLYSALTTRSHADDEWYVDSGATKHMTYMNLNLENKRKPEISEVRVANNQKVKIDHVGDFKCKINDEQKVLTLREIQCVPDLCVNLLSVSQIVKRGNTVVFTIDGCKIYNKNNELIATGDLVDDMFKMNIKASEFACANSVNKKYDDFVLWHRRLAHANFKTLKSLFQWNSTPDTKCEVCAKGKQARQPFSDSGTRATKLLEIVHSDVCGKMPVRSLGGSNYFVTFIDDFSRKIFIFPIKSKDDVFTIFVEFKNRVENETEHKIKTMRSDNGTEYVNKKFQNFFAEHGIKHEKSAPYSPQQNGLAERNNRSIIEKARCMLLDAQLSKQFWGEAVCAAVSILNVLPNAANNVSPNERWSGKKCKLNNFKVFGCKAMVWQPEQKRKKLDAKSFACIFLRIADDAKAYRLYNLKTKKIVISRDVIFMENSVIDQNISNNKSFNLIKYEESDDDIESGESTERTIFQEETPEIADSGENSNAEPATSIETSDESTTSDQGTEQLDQSEDFGQAEESYETDEMNESSDPTFNTRAKVDESAERPTTRNFMKNILNFHTAFITCEPSSYQQALKDENCDKWKIAMKEEYDALIKNDTWDLVERPPNKKLVDNRWVYKVKENNVNLPVRFKARLVARGFTQQYGVNYNETFSPVVRFTSIRVILAVAAQRRMHMKQFDVKTAFLNGDLKETVYMEQPVGFRDGSNRVCKLKRSLYGLKQASRCWNEKFTSFIKLFGFKQSRADPCVYVSKKNEALIFLAIHVDDGLVVGENPDDIKSVMQHLGEHFEIKEMDVSCFLGLEILQNANGSIFVHQSAYAEKVLRKFNMQNCERVCTPSDANQNLHDFTESSASNYPYRELVGSLMYLAVGTRPDIAHAVGVASRFLDKPMIVHERAAKRILKYLKGSLNFGILFSNSKINELGAYSDADFAGDVETRKSTSGYAFIYCGGIISWSSERQKSVSLSTTESEYIAASQCVKELVWLRQILCEILELKSIEIVLYMDNQSAIRLIKNPEFHKRTKHIDVRYHFIREKYENNLFTLNYISTNEMIADVFTKALPAQKFNFLRNKLGLMTPKCFSN